MSGGHWDYLYTQLQERAGQPLNELWMLLAQIEHELDYGICGDTCYECAKIRVIAALESYFDTAATSVQDGLRILRSSESECERCRKVDAARSRSGPVPRDSASIVVYHDGKRYHGEVHADEGD